MINEDITSGKKESPAATDKIDYFFDNLNDKAVEAVKITPELHKRIKILATHSNSTITTIVNNILLAELDKHNPEIQKFIKKNMI